MAVMPDNVITRNAFAIAASFSQAFIEMLIENLDIVPNAYKTRHIFALYILRKAMTKKDFRLHNSNSTLNRGKNQLCAYNHSKSLVVGALALHLVQAFMFGISG